MPNHDHPSAHFTANVESPLIILADSNLKFVGAMQTLIATLVLFAVVMAAMGIGVMVSGRSLRGSCGGTGERCDCSAARRRACAAAESQGD